LLDCVVFKIFASLGLCDHIYSFMAIVYIVCLLASHEWKDASQVHNSQSLINSLNYLRENLQSWNIIKSSVNEAYIEGLNSRCHDKSGNLSSPKKIEMDGLHDHQIRPMSKMECSLFWKFLILSSNHRYVKKSIPFIFKQHVEVLENPF
jgi:hypothetical protein